MVFYCYLVACSASRHNCHVIASDMGLLVSGTVRQIITQVPAGHFPDDMVPDIGDQARVLDVQICHDVVADPADVFHMALGICGEVFRTDILRRMPSGYILSLKAGQGGRLEYVLRIPIDLHQTVRLTVELKLLGKILLLTRPGDGHIVADEISFRRVCHVWGNPIPVVSNQASSPRR